jgi:hypothetical protein
MTPRHQHDLPPAFARRFGDLTPAEQLAQWTALSIEDGQEFAAAIVSSVEARRAIEVGRVCGLQSMGSVTARFVAGLRAAA